jgi:integrative and conjugative element protein (TIGR02256 family)
MKRNKQNNRTIIFSDTRGNKFELGCSALITMTEFVQIGNFKTEAGGVLLGRYIVDCEDVVVDCITPPLDGDKRSRFLFFRTAQSHQRIINHAWRSSKGICNYLGEWHTHPEPDPSPSTHDTLNWKRKLRFDKYDSDYLFFVIIGIRRINAWKGSREDGAIKKLTQIS